jgi:hypothetical protein
LTPKLAAQLSGKPATRARRGLPLLDQFLIPKELRDGSGRFLADKQVKNVTLPYALHCSYK